MDITQVKVFPVREEKLKAFVSVVFDHSFMVNDIKIIQGRDGLFLSMPSRRKKSGEFKDIAHPLNNETRRILEDRVLDAYRETVDESIPRRATSEQPVEIPSVPTSPTVPTAPEAVGVVARVAQVAPPAEKSLEEVQELHLRDSFWSVS